MVLFIGIIYLCMFMAKRVVKQIRFIYFPCILNQHNPWSNTSYLPHYIHVTYTSTFDDLTEIPTVIDHLQFVQAGINKIWRAVVIGGSRGG